MKNSLSHICHALQTAFEQQPQGSARWVDGVEIVERTEDESSTPIWWVTTTAVERLLTPEQLDELDEAGCLGNRGIAKSIRLGKTAKRAICVNISLLRKSIRSAETKAAKTAGADKKIKELQIELKTAREYNATDEAYARLINEIRGYVRLKPYKPGEQVFKRTARSKNRNTDGVPTLFLSDWHFGEVVSIVETEMLNEYNVKIAKERAQRIFAAAMDTLFPPGAERNYEGIVIAFGGDMLSGLIHEDLRATNELCMPMCLKELSELLCDQICMFAMEFPMVYVPCVGGNHGRWEKNPKAKKASVDNWEYMLYIMTAELVKRTLGKTCNVQFTISESRELCFRVYNTTYLLTHGDEGLKGGRDSAEFWSNLLRSAQQKLRKSPAQFGGYDVLMSAHFHRYGAVGNVVCNGSLKGFDELGVKESYCNEEPAQALWVTHPVRGANNHTRLYAEDAVSDELWNAPPLTLPKVQPMLANQ